MPSAVYVLLSLLRKTLKQISTAVSLNCTFCQVKVQFSLGKQVVKVNSSQLKVPVQTSQANTGEGMKAHLAS